MNQYTAVPHAKIIGGRFTFTPFQSLELGASRIMQGAGRATAIIQQFLGWVLLGKDNTGTDNEPGTNWPGLTLSSNLSQPLAGR